MNKDLTVGKPTTVLWKFCLPLFGSIIFQQLYNLADSFVAGKFIGEDALAAVGNSYEITLIFIAFAFGCNIGCSVIVFRREELFRCKDIRLYNMDCGRCALRGPDDIRITFRKTSFGTHKHPRIGHERFRAVSRYIHMGTAVCIFL